MTRFSGVHEVVTMKKDVHYFPTTEWRRDSSEQLGWRKISHEKED
jgi:hypothetical protein